MIADSQCHVSPVWYEPVESLLDQMQRNGVDYAILVQMIGQTDNGYQQACLERFPGRFASVVWIDPQGTDAFTQLQRLAGEGAAGIRLRPSARSAGPDPLALWREADRLGLAVSCVGNAAEFGAENFFELVDRLPTLSIVLEHLGGTSQPDAGAAAVAARRRVFELAQYPNVYLKVPGLGELLPRTMPPVAEGSPFIDSTPSILKDALSQFGAERLMWGSDFPPVASREGYTNALQLCKAAVAHLPATDRALIFGAVACRVFKIPARIRAFVATSDS